MKTNILTTNCIGFNKEMSRTFPRLDSLSIVSRQSVLAILVLCLTVLGVGNAWGAETTFDWAGSSTATAGTTDYVVTTSPITLTFAKGTNASNAPRTNKEGSVRMYTGTTLTIASSSGNITRVVFTPTSATYDATHLTYSGNALTSDDWTLASASASVTLSATAAARFTSIKVYSGSSTYTVTIAKNQDSWGTVSANSVGSVASNTSISAASNVLTVGASTVTATPHVQDADYDYAFSSWTGIPGSGKVTENITVTANFTRTARPLTNYRTTCCTELATISGSFASSTSSSATVTWTIPVDGSSNKKAAGVILHLYADDNNAQGAEIVGKVADYSSDNTTTSHTFTGLDASTKYWFTIEMKGTTAGGVEYCDAEEGAAVSFTTAAAACVGQFSLHTGNNSQGGWVTNQCFEDADWGSDDDAIYVGAFPLTNECYVGYAGGGSAHGTNWAVGGIKTYDIPTGRTLGWNGSDYYQDYPGGALGTFHIHKNSSDENFYLRFKPSSYILRTGANSTWTSREMTVSATNAHYYETDPLTLTAALIDEHAYVDLKTSGGDGHVWCNFSSDVTAENNVKVKSGFGDEDAKFRATNLADGDAGKYGKFRIDVTKDVNNWKLAFVPMYKITYAAGTGASGSMDPSSYQEIGGTIAAAANGFTAPTYKQFAGWSGSDGNSYAAGANVTMNSDVTLTAQWEDIPVTALTLNKSSIATYVNASTQTLNVSAVTPATANPAVTWSSSDATVASVTAGGVVSFLKAGTATITARSTISTGITATCTVNVYSVTCVVNGDDDVALAGVGIPTLTFTPATRTLTTSETGNYVFKSMTQSGGAWATSPSTTTGTTTAVLSATPTGNVTVTATYYKPRTVTWHVGDATGTTDNVKRGTLFSALDPESDAPAHGDGELSACGSTKFIGWVKASGAYTDDGKTVDWYNTYKYDAADQITDDVDIYAMYAEASSVTKTMEFTISPSDFNSTSYAANNNEKTTTATATDASGATLDVKWTSYQVMLQSSNMQWQKNAGYIYNSTDLGTVNSVTITSTAGVYSTAYGTSEQPASGAAGTGKGYFKTTINNTETGTMSSYVVNFTKTTTTYINYRTGCSVSCGMPTSLTNTSVNKTGATISWTDAGAGTASKYEYIVWEDGDDEPTSGFVNNSTNTSATLSGLYSGVKYNWKVRKVCTGTDGDSRWAYSFFTTTAADLTLSVPTGATPVAGQSCTEALPSAGVPTDCGSCWAFVGWTTAAYPASSSIPGTLYFEDDIVKVSGDATLHAVYQNSKYKRISSTDDLVANNNYVIGQMPSSTMYALSNTPQASYPATDAAVTDVTSNMETVGDDKFIKNVGLNNIWKFTGTYSSGQLYNAAADKYLNLTSQENSVLNTTDNLTFAVSEELWTINSTYYLGGYLSPSEGFDAADAATLASSRNKSYIYRQLSCTFATTPDCPKYTVTWNVNNATSSTSYVTKCAGYLASLPDAPSNTTLSSCQTNGKFMGWSPTKVMPAQDVVPTGMFSEVEYSPEITQDTTFYAVFAEEHSGATGTTNRTYTFTSASWGDDESAWSSGADGNWASSAVQVPKSKTGANATTKSSYDDVTKVTVTYFTNASSGAGSIDIKVNGTSYTGSASVTNSGGTTPRTINFTPPSSALDGAVKITVTCTDNSIYIKSVQIFYTGSTTTYDQYRTACCNDPQLKFLDGEGDPTTEYVIVREDLASSSAGVTIGCDISSLNTTGTISWTSTHRDKNDYASAYTWSSTQPVNLNIDIAKEEITAKETGVWQITISQAAGATTYCPEDATVTVRVKTIDKFVDAVNGNFSGEPQSLEDTGNGILLPTEAMFSTNNGCSTTRRLIGWIKASDLATYASSRRVDMIDDLKTSDPATNKVIAPGTKVQATGVTWYAVWGVEK